jgi:hypothetical protein
MGVAVLVEIVFGAFLEQWFTIELEVVGFNSFYLYCFLIPLELDEIELSSDFIWATIFPALNFTLTLLL